MLFLWTTSDKIPEALKVMKDWGFAFIDSAVWNRDIIKQGGDWVKNQHNLLLIGMKGNYEVPHPELRLESIHFDHKTDAMIWTPDYYYSIIELMCPGATYLEVFSCRQYGDRWVLLDNLKEEAEE